MRFKSAPHTSQDFVCAGVVSKKVKGLFGSIFLVAVDKAAYSW
jgi:hypothetical protein